MYVENDGLMFAFDLLTKQHVQTMQLRISLGGGNSVWELLKCAHVEEIVYHGKKHIHYSSVWRNSLINKLPIKICEKG